MDHSQQKEYAFEMAASSIRFGPGCTKEVGMDFKNLGVKKIMVVTDGTVEKLNTMKVVRQALDREGIAYEVFSKTRVEPKDSSYVSFHTSRARTDNMQYQRSNRLCKAPQPRGLSRCRRWLRH